MIENYKLFHIHFLIRPGMYAGKTEPDCILAFFSGLDFGTNRKFRFHSDLYQWVDAKYRIKSNTCSWSGLFEVLAKRRKTDWFSTFAREGFSYLITLLDEKDVEELYETFGDAFPSGTQFEKHLKSLRVEVKNEFLKKKFLEERNKSKSK